MKARTSVIGLALVVALLGAVMVVSYARKADARATAGQEVRDVYIAAKPVPQGTSEKEAIDQKLVVLQKVVAKGVPTGALSESASNAADVVALSDISAGEVVLAARFGPPTEVESASGVPRGRVAISVGLSDPAGIKPYLKRGAHIALYDTYNARKTTAPLTPYGAHLNDDKPTVRATGVVLPDVEVISVSVPKTGGAGSSSSPSGGALLVTVAVAPSDATRLVHAIQTGNLYAALLGPDAKVLAGASSSDNDVVGP